MLNDFDVGTEPLAMYVPTMYYCMEVDKVAFGTQGHTQKESYRKWHLAIVMCPFPSLYCYRLQWRAVCAEPRLQHQLYAIEVELLESTLQQQTP